MINTIVIIINNLFIKTKPSAGQGQIDDATKILNEALIAKATADLKASRNALRENMLI